MSRRPLLAVPLVAIVATACGPVGARAGHQPRAAAERGPVVRAGAVAPAPTPTPAPAPAVVSTHTMVVGGLTREWEQLSPGGATAASAPILVVLHGQAVTAAQEVERDGLVPLVTAGRAELIYPQGIGTSWNAGGCCAAAMAMRVDDVGFVRTLVAQVDPGRTRPVFLIGYSNGGRLAYTVACQDPTVVDGFAVVDAMPQNGCTLARPVTILQVDATADPAIPYQPGDPGAEQPPATTQVERLRLLDGCAVAPVTVTTGHLSMATWSGCQDGTRLGFATYIGANHFWPAGDATTPGAGPVIWDFLSQGRPW